MKRLLPILVFILFLTACGGNPQPVINSIDDLARHYNSIDDIIRAGYTHYELVQLGASNADDLLRIGVRNADDLAGLGVKSADDLWTLGLNSQDELARVGVSTADDLGRLGITAADGTPIDVVALMRQAFFQSDIDKAILASSDNLIYDIQNKGWSLTAEQTQKLKNAAKSVTCNILIKGMKGDLLTQGQYDELRALAVNSLGEDLGTFAEDVLLNGLYVSDSLTALGSDTSADATIFKSAAVASCKLKN